jgi:hypothetical protein
MSSAAARAPRFRGLRSSHRYGNRSLKRAGARLSHSSVTTEAVKLNHGPLGKPTNTLAPPTGAGSAGICAGLAALACPVSAVMQNTWSS